MPRIDNQPEKTIDAASLNPIKRYELGLVQFGDRVLLCIEVTTNGHLIGTEVTTTYAMSMAGAVQFGTDLTAVLESNEGINALVRETLADAPTVRARLAANRTGRDADEISESAVHRAAHDSAPCICDVCGYAVADHAHEAVDRACAAAKEG